MASGLRSGPLHQRFAAAPQDSRSDCNDHPTTRGGLTSSLSFASTNVSSSRLAGPTSHLESKPTCPTSSSAHSSRTRAPSQQQSPRTQGVADEDRTTEAACIPSSSSSSHPNVCLEIDAIPDARGDNHVSNIPVYLGSDSESGLPLVPVSAEEGIWGTSASGNGPSRLPAHARGLLSPANHNASSCCYPSHSASQLTVTAATSTATSVAAACQRPHRLIASAMSASSADASTASIGPAISVPVIAQHDRDTYTYDNARTQDDATAPSSTTSSALTPTATTRSDQPSNAPSFSILSDAAGQTCNIAHPCAGPTSRFDARSWSRENSGAGSGTGTPAALDTPAFRTPLGVYNGFVHDRRDEKEGYFPPSSSSVSSAILAVSDRLREETKEQSLKRPQLRHLPTFARDVQQAEETSPKQALSLLALPGELVSHILRMGYFSPPTPPSLGPDLKASVVSTPSATSPPASNTSRLYTHTSAGLTPSENQQGGLLLSEDDSSSSATDDGQYQNEEIDHEDEDDTPPTIISDPHLRLALLHTCRALRAAVFADPALWSVVRLGPGDGEVGVRRALGASPFPRHHLSAVRKGKGAEGESDVGKFDETYLGHQLALARAHPLKISLTAFWGRCERVEGREVDVSERVFAILSGAHLPSRSPNSWNNTVHHSEERTRRWEAFELVCPREDEWAVLAQVTAHRSFPQLIYLSLTFIGRSSGSTIPVSISTPVSALRRRAAATRRGRGEPRERRTRDRRPGARHSVALPSGAFGGWRAGALPSLRGLLLRGVDLEGVVEDVLEHEYETQDDSECELELDGKLEDDMFQVSTSANFEPPEPALPALCALDVRGHGLWPDADALNAFFARHAKSLRRLGLHVRSGDVLHDIMTGQAALDGPTSMVPAPTSPLRIPNLRVLEVDTSEGLNRYTARMVRLLSDAAVFESEDGPSKMRRVVVKERGGIQGEELLRWSHTSRLRPSNGTASTFEARLAITNSTISSALGALPLAMLRPVGVLALDVPAGEGGWGDARCLRQLLSVFGNKDSDTVRQVDHTADSIRLGRLRRVEVCNLDALGVCREVLAQPRMSTSEFQFEHDEAADDEDEDGWERFLSSEGMAEPMCAAQELVVSFSETTYGDEDLSTHRFSAAATFVSLFNGSGWSGWSGCAPNPSTSSVMIPNSPLTVTYANLQRVILKGPTHSQVTEVVRTFSSGVARRVALNGPQIRAQDIRL